MINIPPIFTPILDEEIQNLVTSQEESIRKVVRNLNFLGNLQPLGTISYVDVNQPGVTPVSSTMQIFCDGSEITVPSSPLRSIGLNLRFTPNLVNRFPRASDTDTGNPTGGSDFWAIEHGHGDFTGGMNNNGSINGEEGDERKGTVAHTHSMEKSLTSGSFDWPAYIGLAPYMKIR